MVDFTGRVVVGLTVGTALSGLLVEGLPEGVARTGLADGAVLTGLLVEGLPEGVALTGLTVGTKIAFDGDADKVDVGALLNC